MYAIYFSVTTVYITFFFKPVMHVSSWTSGSKIKIYTWEELNRKSWFTFCANCINLVLWLTSLGWGNLYNELGYSFTFLNGYINEIILNCRRLPQPWEKKMGSIIEYFLLSFSSFARHTEVLACWRRNRPFDGHWAEWFMQGYCLWSFEYLAVDFSILLPWRFSWL